MSKIGEKAIEIPQGVSIDLQGVDIHVKGAAGEMHLKIPKTLQAEREGETIILKRLQQDRRVKALHGLYRSLVANAVRGVHNPWEKKLEVVGTGYNVKLQGEDLVFKLGYSHAIEIKKVPGITFKVQGNNKLSIVGFDKNQVGDMAYKIRALKKPDVYKGKGIKYEGEWIRIKPGKKAKAAE